MVAVVGFEGVDPMAGIVALGGGHHAGVQQPRGNDTPKQTADHRSRCHRCNQVGHIHHDCPIQILWPAPHATLPCMGHRRRSTTTNSSTAICRLRAPLVHQHRSCMGEEHSLTTGQAMKYIISTASKPHWAISVAGARRQNTVLLRPRLVAPSSAPSVFEESPAYSTISSYNPLSPASSQYYIIKDYPFHLLSVRLL